MCNITIKEKEMDGLSNHVLMVRPYLFRKNEQTAINNYYQNESSFNLKDTHEMALCEFDGLVKKLISSGIKVTIHQDTKQPETPDSIFPNNWLSFHKKNRVIIYPMFAPNRRNERSEDVFLTLKNEGVNPKIIHDYTKHEKQNMFLEGTGSMVLDRINKKLYASLSERTNKKLVLSFSKTMKYKPIIFSSFQTASNKRLNIYHTNVMMSIGDSFAAICFDSIDDVLERDLVHNELLNDGKEIICLSEKQIDSFAGNMLLLKNSKHSILFMSTSAYKSLSKEQISQFEKHTKIVHSNIGTIEKSGGGSVRCMLAEIF